MIKVTVYGEEYVCDVAVKKTNCIKLYTSNVEIASFEGITDFSGYSTEGGTWSEPEPTENELLQSQIDSILLALLEV